MPSYVAPLFPFPFPKNLECGQPYINWPEGKDIVGANSISVDVAIPETGVQVGAGQDANVNKTMEMYSLVLPRARTVRCDKTKFVPMYRNKIFETSDDKFFTPGAAYLEYLGPPSAHVKDHSCSTPYHLLSTKIELTGIAPYHLLSNEGNDWLFHLYSGDTGDRPYDMPSRPPLTISPMVKVCDNMGKHTKYVPGAPFVCDFPPYEAQPPVDCSTPTPSSTPWRPAPGKSQPSQGEGLGVLFGIMIGVFLGFLALAGLVMVVIRNMPQIRRRMRGEAAIQL